MSRLPIASNFDPPALLNLMSTAHSPVLAPVWVWARAGSASVIDVPESSTGPRMNLVAPVGSHVMSGLSSGARLAFCAALPLQSKLSYSACRAGVT